MEAQDETLAAVVLLLARASRKIAQAFPVERGPAGGLNVQGERQTRLDTYADDVLVSVLRDSRLVKHIASEERREIVEITDSSAGLSVTMDPLDGSSLVDVNAAVGTIVGIYDSGGVLQPGANALCAMYFLYGPTTTLVYADPNGVHEFLLTQGGQYELLQENLAIGSGKLYSPGGLRKDCLPVHDELVQALENSGYKLRYSGSFVSDFNQILHNGGVFMYPATTKYPEGKLRLLYEANPIGRIVSQAGGRISDGFKNILEMEPKAIHQRIPVYVGGKEEISLVEKMFSQE